MWLGGMVPVCCGVWRCVMLRLCHSIIFHGWWFIIIIIGDIDDKGVVISGYFVTTWSHVYGGVI